MSSSLKAQQGVKRGRVEKKKSSDSDVVKKTEDVYKGFEIPPSLKRQLVDDWEYITQEKKLVTLPREVPVAEMLTAWLHTTRKKKSPGGSAIQGPVDAQSKEVMEGLRNYFDAALGTMLLYRAERPQYLKIMTTRKQRPSKVYGAEHFLRLLVKLPTMLKKSNMSQEDVRNVGEKVCDICKFMQYNARLLFEEDYTLAASRA